jgi:hypothetical protein
MAIFECLCCEFSTPKKTLFATHLTTNKHLKNAESNNTPSVNIVHPMPNGVQNNELLQIIKDLEAEVKLKNEIIKMKDDVIETLKQQLSHIPEKQQEQPKTKPTQIKTTIIDTLKQEHNKAVTIDEFRSYFTDEKYNKYIKNVDGSGFTYIIKSIKPEDYIEGVSKTIVDLICSAVNVLPKEKRPFFCSDKKRCEFYVNTKEQGWIDCSKTQLEKYLLMLIRQCSWANGGALGFTVNKLTDDQFFQTYQKNKSDFQNNTETGKQSLVKKLVVTADDNPDNIIAHLKNELSQFTNKNNSTYKIDNDNCSSSESEKEIE